MEGGKWGRKNRRLRGKRRWGGGRKNGRLRGKRRCGRWERGGGRKNGRLRVEL